MEPFIKLTTPDGGYFYIRAEAVLTIDEPLKHVHPEWACAVINDSRSVIENVETVRALVKRAMIGIGPSQKGGH